MELEILSDVKNPLTKRREVKFKVLHDSATMSKAALKEELCKRLNEKPETSIVEKVEQLFGERRSTGIFYAYKDKASMESMEPKYILKRQGLLSEAPKGAGDASGNKEKKQ
ncbi:MAG: 30S ribosomal protein S24e [Candidatus Micrarchaeia archaeon]